MLEFAKTPTDSLYKFMTIGGLTLIVAAVFSLTQIKEDSLSTLHEIEAYETSLTGATAFIKPHRRFGVVCTKFVSYANVVANNLEIDQYDYWPKRNDDKDESNLKFHQRLSFIEGIRANELTSVVKGIDQISKNYVDMQAMKDEIEIQARLQDAQSDDLVVELAERFDLVRLATEDLLAAFTDLETSKRKEVLLEAQRKQLTEKRDLTEKAIWWTLRTGVCVFVVGFVLWAVRHQRYQDKNLRMSVERARIELDQARNATQATNSQS